MYHPDALTSFALDLYNKWQTSVSEKYDTVEHDNTWFPGRYESAAAFLRPHKETLDPMTEQQLNWFIMNAGERFRIKSLFASAILNAADLDNFTLNCTSYNMGFGLKRGKTFTIPPHVTVYFAATRASGAVHNKGTVEWLGNESKGGLFLNEGKVKTFFGAHAKGGVYVNIGEAWFMGYNCSDVLLVNNGEVKHGTSDWDRIFGHDDTGGNCCLNNGKIGTEDTHKECGLSVRGLDDISINNGTVVRMARWAKGGRYINIGSIDDSMGEDAQSCVLINDGYVGENFGLFTKRCRKYNQGDVGHRDGSKQRPYSKRAAILLERLRSLADGVNIRDAQQLLAYDWAKLKQDLRERSEQIDTVLAHP